MELERLGSAVMHGLEAGDLIGGPKSMAGVLGASLAACRGFDPEDVLSRYLAWWQAGGFDTGPVAARVLELVIAGLPPVEAVAQVNQERRGRTAGCNPAHRIAPLAVSPFVADDQLVEAARAEARLTHFDPLAGDVSAAVAVLIRLLARGVPWRSAVAEAAIGRMGLTRQALLDGHAASPKAGGYAPDVLHAAIHFLARHPDFDTALQAAIRFAGPPNYCPVLVGAIGAVRAAASHGMKEEDEG